MTGWAETGCVPPASGVIVSAAALPAGLRTVRMALIIVVFTIAMPTIENRSARRRGNAAESGTWTGKERIVPA